MSPSTCSKSWPRVSTRSVVSAQYMNASSGSGLCPTRIRTKRGTVPLRSALPVEEPARHEGQHFLPRKRAHVHGSPVLLEDAHVVLQRLVRAVERVAELVALEDDVLGTRVVRRAQLRIHHANHGPECARTALDPERDALLAADVVDADKRPLCVPALTGPAPHPRDTIASRGRVQEPLLVSLRARLRRRARRPLCRTRARARTLVARDPRGQVRHESPRPRAAETTARPSRGDRSLLARRRRVGEVVAACGLSPPRPLDQRRPPARALPRPPRARRPTRPDRAT